LIRATTGVWVNYATTLLFQILFASRFGSGSEATSFVVVYGVAIALSGFVITGIRSVLQPRLLTPEGDLVSQPLKIMGVLIAASAAVCAVLALFPESFAELLAPETELSAGVLADLLRVTAAFTFTQIVAGALATVALAHGRRFVPAAVLAIPTTAGAAYIAVMPDAGIEGMYGAILVGGAAQIITLLFTIDRPVRIVSGSTARAGATTLATVGLSALLSAIVPIERVLASSEDSAGGAQYFFASRSLMVGQQLIVGGALLTILSTWSILYSRGQVERLRRSVWATTAVGTVLLVAASCLAIVAGEQIVALVYQHGNFTARDTEVVTDLLLLSLPGFCAEGIGLILSQGMLAARHNRATITIGVGNFALRLSLIFALGYEFGAYGVAAAYSIASLVVLIPQVIVTWSRLGRPHEQVAGIRAAGIVAACTLAAALVLRPVLQVDGLAAVLVLGAVFAALCAATRKSLAALYRLVRET
jgi:putative peptidoglycan lipid II flippase